MEELLYRIECDISDLGEPSRLDERKDDPKSVLIAEISMRGEEAINCLINLLKGILNGDPNNPESKAVIKYFADEIKDDMKKGRETTKKNKLRLVASAKKIGYDRRPTITINVFRWI